MKVADIREAKAHAQRFVTHAEWVLRECERVGKIGAYPPMVITNVYGGPGYDVMQDAAQQLKIALARFRKPKGAKA